MYLPHQSTSNYLYFIVHTCICAVHLTRTGQHVHVYTFLYEPVQYYTMYLSSVFVEFEHEKSYCLSIALSCGNYCSFIAYHSCCVVQCACIRVRVYVYIISPKSVHLECTSSGFVHVCACVFEWLACGSVVWGLATCTQSPCTACLDKLTAWFAYIRWNVGCGSVEVAH